MQLPAPAVLHKILEHSKDIIIVLDDQANCAYVNPAFCRILGYGVEEVLGKDISFLNENLENLIQDVRAVGALNTQLSLKKISPDRKNSGEIITEAEIVLLNGEDSSNSSLILIACNITELFIMRRQLVEIQRMDTTRSLISSAAHELNRELSVIYALTDELGDLISDRETSTRIVSIGSACFRAAGIVKSMQSIDRRPRLSQDEAILVYKSIQNIVAECGLVVFNGIDIKINCNDPRIKTEIEPSKFEQLILNLLINAKEALRGIKNPLVTINIDLKKISSEYATATTDKFVVIEIQDNGAGMNEETKERIFDPHFSTKDYDDRGMGLFICKQIITESGGFIEVESLIDFGTRFKLHLPATDNVSTREIARLQGSLRGEETLIYFEENVNLQRRTAYNIEVFGYNIVRAEFLEQVFEICQSYQEENCTLIFSLWGDREEYLKVLRQLRKVFPSLPIILITDCLTQKLHDEFGENILESPYTAKQILALARKIFDPK